MTHEELEAILQRWIISYPPVARTTIETAQKDIAKLFYHINELESMPLAQTVVKLQKANERLHESLQFYGCQENYKDDFEPVGDGSYGNQTIEPAVIRDGGNIARQALEGESHATL